MASNKPRVTWNGRAKAAQIRRAAEQGVRKAAIRLRALVVLSLGTSARGAKGIRSPAAGAGPPGRNVHSKPGQPPRSDTGKLRQSIYARHDPANLVSYVGTTLNYGAFMELGTSPHEIRAKRARALCFGWHSTPGFGVLEPRQFKGKKEVTAYQIPGGKAFTVERATGKIGTARGMFTASWDWRFFQRVMHPGTAPRPFLMSTLRAHRAELRSIIQREIAAARGG